MIYRLAPSERAMVDVENAFVWYQSQRIGLGWEFVGDVEDAYRRIQIMPLAGRVVHRNIRLGRLSRFPYAVYYRLIGETIEIRRCMHERRNPTEWQAR